MARQPRIDLPGFAQHIIQRGNNRQACFFDDTDRRRYLDCLRLAAEKYGGAVHAYVLMTNHVHLLASGATKGALGRMMQSLGRRYVRYFNSTHQRTGTLWEGRYRSSLVDSERYLLTCYRYIELNPVRAGMAGAPDEYKWSSFGHNAMGFKDQLVSPHESYLALGRSDAERISAYLRLFENTFDDCDLEAIRSHVSQGKVLGSERFRDQIEAILDRSVRLARPGRPRNVL